MPFSKMLTKEDKKGLEEKVQNMTIASNPFFEEDAKVRKKRKDGKDAYTERAATYLTPSVKAEFDTYCRENGITPAAALRMAVTLLLERR